MTKMKKKGYNTFIYQISIFLLSVNPHAWVLSDSYLHAAPEGVENSFLHIQHEEATPSAYDGPENLPAPFHFCGAWNRELRLNLG